MIETLKQIDQRLLLAINGLHSPAMDAFMWTMSMTWPAVILVVVAALIVWRRSGRRKAIELVIGCLVVVACSDLSANAVKHAVKRNRPTHHLEIGPQVHVVNDYRGGQYGFISGHAANTFGMTAFISFYLTWLTLWRRILLFLFPVIVVYSRMYLGVHYPSDIFFGLVDGLFVAGLIAYLLKRFNDRRGEIQAG